MTSADDPNESGPTPSPTGEGASPASSDASPLAGRVLARVASACRSQVSPAALGRLLAQSEPPSGDDVKGPEYLDWLSRVASSLGMRTSLATARAVDAVEVLRGGQPLVAASDQGDRWYFIESQSTGRVKITVFEDDPEGRRGPAAGSIVKVAPDQLATYLGMGSDDVLTWLVAEAATPNANAVSDASAGGPLTPFRRLLRLIEPDRADVVAIVLFAITTGILMLATPIAVQAIVNSAVVGGSLQQLIAVGLLLFIALGFAASLTAVQTWIMELIQRRLFIRTVADVAARLPRVQATAYDSGHGPELVNRFFDVITIQKGAAKLLIDALGVVLSIIVGLAVLAFYHPLLLAFDAGLLLVICVIVFVPLKRGERSAIAESSAKYKVAGWLEEVARSPYTFKAGGSEQWIFERSDALTRGWLESRRLHFRTIFRQIGGGLALQVIASVSLLGIGGLLVIEGTLSLGQLVAAELIVSAVVASVAKMGKHLETWYDVTAGAHKVGQLLDLPIEGRDGESLPRVARGDSGGIEATGLAWKNGRGQTLFTDVSFALEPGQNMAVTGPSGSGKTSLLDLLWRMREPAAGVIRLDGRDLRDLTLDSVRRDIALVSSIEPVHGTLRENVRLRRPFVSGDDIRRALDAAGLRQVVDDLPDGLETIIHPHSRALNQGELERLMLARAIAGSPRVLVVDSLFDGLEEDLRQSVQDALFDPAAPWSLIVVSDDPRVHERAFGLLQLQAGGSATFTTKPQLIANEGDRS